MSRSINFINNSLTAAMLHVVTIIAGFIIPRIMLTVYGSEINGLVTSISQFIAYFNIVEAGLASVAVYSLYKPLADRDSTGVSAILSASRHFYNQAGYIFVSLVLGLTIIYPALIKSIYVTTIEICILVFVIGCSGALEFFTMSKYRVLLTADQKVYVISLASICSIILSTLIIAVLAKLGFSIVVVRAVALCAVFLRSFILYFYVRKNYQYVDYYAKPNNDALKKRWDAFYLQVLGIIHSGAPVVIATFFTNLKTVSVYSIYNMVLGGISGLLSIVLSGLYASFGDVIARNEQDILQKAYQEFELVYYMIITWVYSCSFVLIMPFIKLYTKGVTDADYYVPIIGVLFVINGIMHNIKTPQGMMVFSAGLFKETRVQTTIQGSIAVIAELVFVQIWGLAGILAGSILSNLYRDIDLLFFIPRNVTKLRARNSFYRIVRIFVCIGITLIPFAFIKIETSNYLEWVQNAIFVSIYAFVVIFLINIIFDRKVLMGAIRRLSAVFSKR